MRSWILLGLAFFSACEDKGIGLPCELPGSDDGGVESNTQVVSNAVECPENVCIQMAGRPSGKGPIDSKTGLARRPQPVSYCTATCSSSADCEGGQNCWNEAGSAQMKFVCVKPILLDNVPGPSTGLQCRGICICEKDARRQTNPRLMKPEQNGQCDCVSEDCDCEVATPDQCEE